MDVAPEGYTMVDTRCMMMLAGVIPGGFMNPTMGAPKVFDPGVHLSDARYSRLAQGVVGGCEIARLR